MRAAKQKVENQFAQTFNNTSSPTHALMNEIVAPMAGQYYANATKAAAGRRGAERCEPVLQLRTEVQHSKAQAIQVV